MSTTTINNAPQSVLPFEGGQTPQELLPDALAAIEETLEEDESDEDFDKPYKPVETTKLPIKEADFPVIIRQMLASSPSNRKVPIFISTLSPLTDDGSLQPVQLIDMSWLDSSIDRSLDHYRKRGSVNSFRCDGLMYYLYHRDCRLMFSI